MQLSLGGPPTKGVVCSGTQISPFTPSLHRESFCPQAHGAYTLFQALGSVWCRAKPSSLMDAML